MKHLARQRRVRWLSLLAAGALGLAATGCGSADESSGPGTTASTDRAEPVVTLRFSGFVGERTSVGQYWSWWMDEVERRSGGSIRFETFWDASLLSGPETADALRDGRIDLGHVVPPMYPGKFPLTSVTELPFIGDNVPAGAAAITELVDESEPLRREWAAQGLRPLAWNIGAPGPIGSKRPIRTAADLRGLRIRGNDRSSKALAAAGANLINLDINEVYSSMERSLIDAFFGVPFAFVGPLKLNETTRHLTDIGLGITSAGPLAMSERRWSSLSSEQQRVMLEVSAEAPAKLGELVMAGDEASCELIRSSSVQLYALPASEVERLREVGEQRLRDEWSEEVADSGVAPDEFHAAYAAAVRDAEARFGDYENGLQRCRGGA